MPISDRVFISSKFSVSPFANFMFSIAVLNVIEPSSFLNEIFNEPLLFSVDIIMSSLLMPSPNSITSFPALSMIVSFPSPLL